MTPIHDLEAHYQHLLTCPELIDTRDHLPLFRSLTGRILEIGCDVGNSTTAFLVGESDSVTSIDINPACAENFPGVEKWRFICTDSHSAKTWEGLDQDGVIAIGDSKLCLNRRFNVLFIDGDHSYEGALRDLKWYSKLVASGGLILVHDVLAHDTYPGVWRAFNEFRNCTSYGRVTGKYILSGSYGLGVIEL